MDAAPACRRRLSLPGGQPPAVPRSPAGADLSSHRRFSPSILLPPVHSTAARFVSSVPGSGYYQVPPPLAPTAGGGGGGGSHHARSLSQPPFFSMDSLAPPPYADLAAPAAVPLSPPPPSSFGRGPSGLPPLRSGHRRSQSDTLLGFSQPNLHMPPPALVKREAAVAEGGKSVDNNTLDGLVGSYMNPKGLGVLGFSGDGTQERRGHLDSQVCDPRAWSPADSSENEAESEGGTMPRHCRSLSVDSFMGKFNFGSAGHESSNLHVLPLPPPGAGGAGGLSRSGSGSTGGAAALFATEFANGEFSEAEKKKIIANERLTEIVLTDPKRVKRILNNRVSAAKSKERKVRYMSELERKVQVLQMEATTLSAQVTMVQRDYAGLATQNKEMKIRLQAMEQQAQLRDALNEALSAEVQRLKLAAGEVSDGHMPNSSHQQMSSQVIQLPQLQIQSQPSQPQQAQQQQPQQSARLKVQQQQWNI